MTDFATELDFYKRELYDNILPFWEKYAPDTEHGGFFTCFSNDGLTLLSDDKYLWSQGRMLFVLSRLLMRDELEGRRRCDLIKYADKTRDFLINHARLDNGNCTFLTDRAGNKKPSSTEDGREIFDTSIYADCFVIIGLSEYARYKRDRTALDFALELYLHSKERYFNNRI
jgi:N-acylglucosamine 2-epimerase